MNLETQQARAIQAIYERIPEAEGTQTGVAAARLGVGRARDAAERALKAANRARGDSTKTEAGRAVAAYKAAHAATAKALEEMNQTRASIAQELEYVDRQLAAATRPSEDERQLLPLIISHIRELKVGDAVQLLLQAAKDGDLLTQRAVLAVPAYLTKLPAEVLDRVRTGLHQTLEPEAAVYRERLVDSFEAVNAADRVLAGVVGEYNTPQVRQLIEAAKEAEAA